MIPPQQQPAVQKALQQTFGVHEPDHIEQLTRGLSGSLVCKITVGGKPFLLRVVTATESRDKPTHYFDCMQSAADAGIAPAIRYINAEDRVSITDFITEQYFSMDNARQQMPLLLKRVHALPKFPRRLNYADVAEGIVNRFRASPIGAELELKEVYEQFAAIVKAYPRNEDDWVSCHNDIKKDNIIFDGTRAWLVDWEAAFLNDPYVDLAALGNFVVKNEADELELLQNYFGAPPTDYQRARFHSMSCIVHMFCFALCAMTASVGKPIDLNKTELSFNAFHDRLWNGEIDLGDGEQKLQYGLVHLGEVRRKMGEWRLKKALDFLC